MEDDVPVFLEADGFDVVPGAKIKKPLKDMKLQVFEGTAGGVKIGICEEMIQEMNTQILKSEK